MLILIKKWKGNADGAETQTLLIRANGLGPEYCPVWQMCKWLKLLAANGITRGPLFPHLRQDHCNWETSFNGETEYMKPDTWEKYAKQLFTYIGEISECTSHSIRRSAVKWAARCGAQDNEILQGGRWVEGSTSFRRYIKDGRVLTLSLRQGGGEDPVFKIWVWQPTVVDNIRPSDLASGGGLT
jgi:hypothetical protein